MKSVIIGLSVLILCLPCVAEMSADWPEFRGPTAQGIALDATPPKTWGPEENIAWRTPLPGAGWSSPVLRNGAIYLTAAHLDDERNPTSLRAICVDAETGELRWDVEALSWSGRSKRQPKNGYASPTPIAADGRVYVHFGHMGTACLDTAGKVMWRQTGLPYNTPHGNGASPVLFDGKLIYSADDAEEPFIVALDADTGEVIWKTARITDANLKFSFCTPLIIEDEGRQLAVSPGSGFVGAYDIADGNEVWRVNYGEGFSVVPRPVLAHGLIYVANGFTRPCTLHAIRTGGRGDVTDSHVAWTITEGVPHTPSMLAVGDGLYFISDKGKFSCVDARTGKVHWQEELDGNFSASLSWADGRIYATNEKGMTTVVNAGKEFAVLAQNGLGETTLASIAFSGSALFLRTEEALYRIEAR